MLEEIITREVQLYQQNRAKLFLEAAIGTLLRVFPTTEVIQMLQAQAEHLKEFE